MTKIVRSLKPRSPYLDLNTLKVELGGKAEKSHTHEAGDINGIKVQALDVTIADSSNLIQSNNVEGALDEIVKKCETIDGKLAGKANVKHSHSSDDLDGLVVKAAEVTIADNSNKFDASNVEEALLENKTNIGDLKQLSTSAKGSIVGAVNELFQNVSDGKSRLATAITDKGIETSDDATFETMATNISNIESGSPFPEGWLEDRVGEVRDNNIKKDDTICLSRKTELENSITLSSIQLPDPLPPSVAAVAFSKDKKYLALLTKVDNGDNTVHLYVYEYNEGKFTKFPNSTIPIYLDDIEKEAFIKFTPSGDHILIGITHSIGITSKLFIYAIDSSKSMTQLYDTHFDGGVLGIDTYTHYNSQGTAEYDLCAAVGDRGVGLNILKTNEYGGVEFIASRQSSGVTDTDGFSSCAFTTDGRYVISTFYEDVYGTGTKNTQLWDMDEKILKDAKNLPTADYVVTLDNGLVLFSKNKTIELFSYDSDTYKFTKINTFNNSNFDLNGSLDRIVFSPYGNYAVGIKDEKLYYFKLEENNLTKVDNIFTERIKTTEDLDFSKDGLYVCVNSKIYDMPSGNIVTGIKPNQYPSKKQQIYYGIARESKNVGEEINVTIFPKFSL